MKKTRQVRVGNVVIGGDEDKQIVIQSMTNTKTADYLATIEQINRLEAAGCQIARFAVNNKDDVAAIKSIKKSVHIPIVADIQFDYKMAIESIKAGIDKVRFNPAYVGGEGHVKEIANYAKAAGVAIRIGINSGSIESEILNEHGNTAIALVKSAQKSLLLLEKCGFYDTVVSVKSSSVKKTIEANRALSESIDYPLHIGVTESGTEKLGIYKSAVGIGGLLIEGIGDTIRVSLTGDPVKEIAVARYILRAAERETDFVEVISCPTCDRCAMDLQAYASEIEAYTDNIRVPLKIAVMGCAVNGIGEAKNADFGVAGGKDNAVLFEKGQITATIKHDQIIPMLKQMIDKYIKNQ